MIDTLHNIKTGERHATDPHQFEAFDHLVSNPRAALFLGMSLSKTVIALSYLFEMHYREVAIRRTLVIAPDKVARITWPDQINTWEHLQGLRYSVIAGDAKKRLKALEADAEVFIIGVDNLDWLIGLYLKKVSGKWRGALPFDSVLIDELSIFKSRGSQRFKALKRAVEPIEYRIGMTGTPSPNGYIDLWAQMFILDDGARLGETFGKFVDKYFTTRGNGMIVYEYKPRPGAANVIAKKIQDIALTIDTDDAGIELPKVIPIDEVLELEPYDREVYDQLEREYCLEFFSGDVTVKTGADLVNKLLQISSGAVYEDRIDPRAARVWHEVNTLKIEALGALLNKHPSETFIVVYQFKHEIDRIKAVYPFARELGKGARTAQDILDWNAGKIRLLLLHPASAGHGLNLQFGGRRMVWYTPTWNLEHFLQTIARLRRRGVTRAVFNHNLIIRGTRDEVVAKRTQAKDDDQTFILNQIKILRAKYGNLRK